MPRLVVEAPVFASVCVSWKPGAFDTTVKPATREEVTRAVRKYLTIRE